MEDNKTYLAFDIGGTTIKYGLVDSQLNISNYNKVETLKNKDNHILKTLLRLTAEFQARYQLSGIGISSAGIVKDGSILYAGPTIPNYQGTQIQAELESQSKLPVFVVNDVDAALLGEQIDGVAKGSNSAYCVALGTGIGGAFVNNGQLMNGNHYYANSIGYTLYDNKTKTDYENRASTLTLEHTLTDYNVSVIEAFEYAKQRIDPYYKIIDDWALEVAKGLSNIILLFDPEILVIGGAVSKQGNFLLKLLNEKIEELVPQGLFKTQLRIAQLADKSQIYGAVSKFLK